MLPHFSEWRFTGDGQSTQRNPSHVVELASGPAVDAEPVRARCSHISVVEKHVLLGDGTVGVLRTSKFGRAECVPGLEPEKFVPPVVEEVKDEKDKKKPGASPKAKAKGKKGKGKQVVDPAVEEAERRAEEERRKAEEAARKKAIDEAEEKAAGFQSSPLMEVRDAVFHQPGCSFGMHPDLSWIARKRARHAAAQAHVQGEYQAALAAAVEAAGEDEEAQAAAREEVFKPGPVEDDLAAVDYGVLYVAYEDGGRAVTRMDHAAVGEGDLSDEIIPGSSLTYISSSGMTLDVTSAATISWSASNAAPVERRRDERDDVHWPVGVEASRPADQSGGTGPAVRFAPGCREDKEVARTVCSTGVIIRTLDSGRKEIYFPDGTRAWRNPRVEEVAMKTKSPTCSSFVSTQLMSAYTHERFTFDSSPIVDGMGFPAIVRDGLPGHWLVVKPDGGVFGRMSAADAAGSQARAEDFVTSQPPEDPEADPEAAALHQQDVAAAQEKAAIERALHPPWGDWLMAVVTEDVEGPLEYQLGVLPHAEVVDPETSEIVGLSASGVLRLSSQDGNDAATLFPDGTRFQQGAAGLSITRDGHPEVSITRTGERIAMSVVCADGTRAECTPQVLDPRTGDMIPTEGESTHAFVALRVPSGNLLRSLGDGEVEVVPRSHARDTVTASRTGIAVAHCERNYVSAFDGETTLVLACRGGEPNLEIDGHDLPSPRAHLPAKPYVQDCATPVPLASPDPRVFVIYGSGAAEEWLTKDAAEQALTVNTDGEDFLAKGSVDKGVGMKCVFKATTSSEPQKPLAGLPLPGVLGGLSAPATAPQTLLGTDFWKTRCLIEYPDLDEDTRSTVADSLEWYEYWEMLQAKPKEDPNAKKKKKPAKAKKKKAVEEEVVQVKVPTGKPFTPFKLEVETLALRAASRARAEPTSRELVQGALAGAQQAEQEVPVEEDSLDDFYGGEPSAAPFEEEPSAPMQQSTLTDDLPPARRADFPIPKAQVPTFQYFFSEEGLGWLMESGEINRNNFVPKPSIPDLPAPTFPSAWEPRTVDEQAEHEAQAQAQAEYEAAAAYAQMQETEISEQERNLQEVVPDPAPTHGLGYLGDVVRTEDVIHERPSSPPGPHPDKKSVKYDVYGEHRPLPPPAPKAFLGPNTTFLEVEAETDRRVRTGSVVMKKNARLAPSVQEVRRAGLHVLRGLSEKRGVGAVPDADVQARDPQMTSTMQGLGDPSCLVEVAPGALRFGTLRAGGVYRLAVFVKNLDVDVTRYTVKAMEEPFLKLWYAHTPLAPGMSVKIVVEVRAHAPARIDTFLDVRVKAHCIKVPVVARVLDAEEYDSLETESLRLHGRKLVKRGVELVTDEQYCKKALGDAYAVPLDQLGGETTSLDS